MAERKGFGGRGKGKGRDERRGWRYTWNGAKGNVESRVGGVLGGHFERIYRLFGGRAPLGHSQGWLVCHITNPQDPFPPARALHREKNVVYSTLMFLLALLTRPSSGYDTGCNDVCLDVSS